MRSIEIKNLRCFRGTGPIALAPLTLLVGENSTGKSTLLAGLRLAWDAALGEKAIDFNEDPFLLGAYDQIAHFRGGKSGRASEFQISSSLQLLGGPEVHFRTRFARHRAQPTPVEQTLSAGDIRLEAVTSSPGVRAALSVEVGDRRWAFDSDSTPFRVPRAEGRVVDWDGILWRLSKREYAPEFDSDLCARFSALWGALIHTKATHETRPFVYAPVRTKPYRTYDPISETPTAEGAHIPILMEQAYFRDREKWDAIRQFLETFAQASGLFRNIQIRPLGKSESDPFQVRVTIAGPPTNMIDAGYGISQILPIVVSVLLQPESKVFMFQQPEVHLHPRAQAELSTLFQNFLQYKDCNQLIVETHSDHLIDRVRADVRDGHWAPDDVAILFFERRRLEVRIHRIAIDERGNLVGAPLSYRRFFLQEEERILGI